MGLRAAVGRPVASARRLGIRLVRSGPRTVLLVTPVGPRFGNYLYYWLHAHLQQHQGRHYRVAIADHQQEWVRRLPAVRALTLLPGQQPAIRDRREWPHPLQFQRWGVDYDREQLHAFVRERLLTSSWLTAQESPPADVVVVHVRRGDYYAQPQFRRLYGFDVLGYLRSAAAVLEQEAPVGTYLVVSDDADWCRASLGPTLTAGGARFEVAAQSADQFESFRTIASARRLIATNSTFSYWAGFIGNVRFGADSRVVVPELHSRGVNDGRVFQVDPDWHILPVPSDDVG